MQFFFNELKSNFFFNSFILPSHSRIGCDKIIGAVTKITASDLFNDINEDIDREGNEGEDEDKEAEEEDTDVNNLDDENAATMMLQQS